MTQDEINKIKDESTGNLFKLNQLGDNHGK